MNLSLLGDDALVKAFLGMKVALDLRGGGTIEDLPQIQNMRVLVIALLDAQEGAALADEPPIAVNPPAGPRS